MCIAMSFQPEKIQYLIKNLGWGWLQSQNEAKFSPKT